MGRPTLPTGPDPNGHKWVGAAIVNLNPMRAEHASRTGRHKVLADTMLPIIETYCSGCRQTYQSAADALCTAVENPYLHGGPIGTRKTRKGNTVVEGE